MRTRTPAPVHWIKPNERNWTPASVIYFDTETEPIPGTEPEVNRLVLWSAWHDIRRAVKHAELESVTADGFTGAELAEWITKRQRGLESTWIYAHNLAFDLTSANLLHELSECGWSLNGNFSTSDHAPFFRLAKGSKRLVLTDSWSWLPDALESIGRAIGKKKPPLPPADDTEALRHRCQADVDILGRAIGDLMDWWDKEDLGNWSITGASCGWNTYRHKAPAKSVLVKPDKEGRDDDSLASYGGRRDAWRFGTMKHGPFIELDFRDAHPTICAHLTLPKERGRLRHGDELPPRNFDGFYFGTIAECVVRTDQPRYPVRIGRHVLYPTGTFRTTLAGPELHMASERGELVCVDRGRWHTLGRSLQPWAKWVLSVSTSTDPDTPAVAKMAAKAWGRSVVGKFAGRTSRLISTRPTPLPGFNVTHGYNLAHHTQARWVQVLGQEHEFILDDWSDNAYPAVWCWVESHLRVRMATVIDALPPECLITCNTDGIIVDATRLRMASAKASRAKSSERTDRDAISRWCQKISEQTWPLELRIKNVFREVNVAGPSQMWVDEVRRWSGVRKDATDNGDYTWTVRDWPKLNWQWQHDARAGYVRPMRTIHARGPYVGRWITAVGTLEVPEMQLDENGCNRIVSWDDTAAGRSGMMRAAVQHPELAKAV